MSSYPRVIAAAPERMGKIKHLFLDSAAGGSREYSARLYLEARIDFADVRSGFHATCAMNHALELGRYEGDVEWTNDMVRAVDPGSILSVRPESSRLADLPGYVTEDLLARVETQYLLYLLKHAEARVYRNFALRLYSLPGETADDFLLRCLDRFKDSFRADMDALREVADRRLEHLKQKCLTGSAAEELLLVRRTSHARNRLHAAAESIAALFLRTSLTLDAEMPVPGYPDPALPEPEQSLETLETDVRRGISRLVEAYRERARNIDEYIVHPNFRDVHLVRTCILWVPAGVLEP